MSSETIYHPHSRLTFTKVAQKQLQTLEFSDRIPYVYRIGWTKQNRFYYGVRFAIGCDPRSFWVDYFTSSAHVQEFRESFGEPDVIEIRRIFETKEQAVAYEHTVLRRLKATQNALWLNRSLGFSTINFDFSAHILVSNESQQTQKYILPEDFEMYQSIGYKRGILEKHSQRMSDWRNEVDEFGVKRSVNIANKIAQNLTAAGKIQERTQKASETKLKIGEDGLNANQRGGKRVSQTLNTLDENGVSLAQKKGKALSKVLNDIDSITGKLNSKLRTEKRIQKLLENNSPKLLIVQIFNQFDELVHECIGDWDDVATENGLPRAAFEKSWRNGGTKLYVNEIPRIQSKMITLGFEKFFGWYAKRLTPEEFKQLKRSS